MLAEIRTISNLANGTVKSETAQNDVTVAQDRLYVAQQNYTIFAQFFYC